MSATLSTKYALNGISALAPVRARSVWQTLARWRGVFSRLTVGWRASCLQHLLVRSFYPSVLAVRMGYAVGIDGLFYEVLNHQFMLESGRPLPTDLALTDLAVARAELLPRALARREAYLLFEQHVVARLHVLLAEGNYYVERWVRKHHRTPWLTILWSVVMQVLRRRRPDNDPIPALRLDPDAFSAFVWSKLWALPELEDVLKSAVPMTRPPSVEGTLDSDAGTIALKVATTLDTDHAGWTHPEKLLRDLHAEIRAASSLAPRDRLVSHALGRVQRAVKRLGDFDDAYARGTAQDPLPEWVSVALEAVDSSDIERLDAESATKLVRRVSCRLWVTGSYPLPEVKPTASAPTQAPLAPTTSMERPAPALRHEEVETGF
jgi:hypothetical protein